MAILSGGGGSAPKKKKPTYTGGGGSPKDGGGLGGLTGGEEPALLRFTTPDPTANPFTGTIRNGSYVESPDVTRAWAPAIPAKPAAAAPAPAPASAPPVSGGTGGGTGGGGAAQAAAQEKAAKAAAESRALIDQARERAAQLAAQLDAQFEQAKADLRDQYKFTETDEEKAALAFMLESLEKQRTDGVAAISNGYGQAVDTIAARHDQLVMDAQVDAEAKAALWTDAADSLVGQMQGITGANDAQGMGDGLRAPGTPVDAFVAMMQASAPREQALTERLGMMAADDNAWLQSLLASESVAKQSDLDRMAMGISADTQARHMQQVNDRVAQERMAYAGSLAGLNDSYMGRALDAGNLDVGLLQALADMEWQTGESQADRDHQWAMMQAEQAAQDRRAAAARAASGGGSGSASRWAAMGITDPESIARLEAIDYATRSENPFVAQSLHEQLGGSALLGMASNPDGSPSAYQNRVVAEQLAAKLGEALPWVSR